MSAIICNQQEKQPFILNKKNRIKFAKEALATKIGVACNCNECKQAIALPRGTYCGKLREQVHDIPNCPHFDFEPQEYKLYRRI